jgi:hypothetical protein
MSLARVRPGVARMERATRDLFGLMPDGVDDVRPWLDHGRWPMRRPLAAEPEPRTLDEPAAQATDYRFLPSKAMACTRSRSARCMPASSSPGISAFHANGETVVRLEQRLGYVHKGIERLMQGKTVAEAARLACRVSGDSAVAHSIAFARAVEAALDRPCPPRADWLRALMAELERIANHLGDFGAICNDAAFSFMQAEATTLREDVLRVCGGVFGHRLMMDKVVPGGVALDVAAIGIGRDPRADQGDPAALQAPGPRLRFQALAARPHDRHRRDRQPSRAPLRRRRVRRPRRRARRRRAHHAGLSALRPSRVRRARAAAGRLSTRG